MRWKSDTGSPLAKARIRAHQLLDVNWRFGGMSRSEAYRLLAERMGLPPAWCHIGMFDEKQCAQAIDILSAPLGADAQNGR